MAGERDTGHQGGWDRRWRWQGRWTGDPRKPQNPHVAERAGSMGQPRPQPGPSGRLLSGPCVSCARPGSLVGRRFLSVSLSRPPVLPGTGPKDSPSPVDWGLLGVTTTAHARLLPTTAPVCGAVTQHQPLSPGRWRPPSLLQTGKWRLAQAQEALGVGSSSQACFHPKGGSVVGAGKTGGLVRGPLHLLGSDLGLLPNLPEQVCDREGTRPQGSGRNRMGAQSPAQRQAQGAAPSLPLSSTLLVQRAHRIWSAHAENGESFFLP